MFEAGSIGAARGGLAGGFPEGRGQSPRRGDHLLGVLMLQTRFPRPLGDIGHPASFDFEVRRCVVEGATPHRVVQGADPALLQPFIEAGLLLVRQGCTALSTSCGFLALWQSEMQAALPVPVWTSSLLQLAELRRRRCGVITINAASLGACHFLAVGADPLTPVEGINPDSALYRTLMQDLPELDQTDAQAQLLAAAQRLRARHPHVEDRKSVV